MKHTDYTLIAVVFFVLSMLSFIGSVSWHFLTVSMEDELQEDKDNRDERLKNGEDTSTLNESIDGLERLVDEQRSYPGSCAIPGVLFLIVGTVIIWYGKRKSKRQELQENP